MFFRLITTLCFLMSFFSVWADAPQVNEEDQAAVVKPAEPVMYGYGIQIIYPGDIGKKKQNILFVKENKGKMQVDFNDIDLERYADLTDGTIWYVVAKEPGVRGTLESGSTFYLQNKLDKSYLTINNGEIDIAGEKGKAQEWTVFGSELVNEKDLEKASKEYVKVADWTSPFRPEQQQGIINGGENVFLGNWSFWKDKKNTDKRFFDPHTKALTRSVRINMRSGPKPVALIIKEKPAGISGGISTVGSLPNPPTVEEIEDNDEVINLITKLNNVEDKLRLLQQQDASGFEIVGQEKDVKELKSRVAGIEYKLFTQKASAYKTNCLEIIAKQADMTKKNDMKNQFGIEEKKLEDIEKKLEADYFGRPAPAPKRSIAEALPASLRQQQAPVSQPPVSQPVQQQAVPQQVPVY